MISINLTGRLTREPELRRIADPDGGAQLEVCQARVAARDRRGKTVFLDIAEWGPAGRAAAQILSKGSLISFTGELRFREAHINDATRQFISAVGHIEFLERREGTGETPVDLAAVPDEEPIPF
jgi:single-stranded DNA-binding protein